MGRKAKYATEEERQAARREQTRQAAERHRAKALETEGRARVRRSFKTDDERLAARKEDKEREKLARPGWQPKFIGIDGESFLTDEPLLDMSGNPTFDAAGNPQYKQAYCLLLRSDKKPLYNPKGLSTLACLAYLTSFGSAGAALVGYFLNFDFEWILKDLTQAQYLALRNGERIDYGPNAGYRLKWIPSKKLVVQSLKRDAQFVPPEERTNKHYWRTVFQDTSGFFQSSFVSALEKWGFKDDPRLEKIKEGKKARGGFKKEDWYKWNEYNRLEMELLTELMPKVYDSFKLAYGEAGLRFAPTMDMWSGPGKFADDFLTQTRFKEEHPPVDAKAASAYAKGSEDFYPTELSRQYPFSLAYFGGRIEVAGVGRFSTTHNYDINSAYPYALSLLPAWDAASFKKRRISGKVSSPNVKRFLAKRLMGMYRVSFEFPSGWTWYPFPVRTKPSGGYNVFYPRQGTTHIMSPELFAALDTLSANEMKYVTILSAYTVTDTEGYGDAMNRLPDYKLCQTAKVTAAMAATRLECKDAAKRVGTPNEQPGDKEKAWAEKALKLILNSLYGKTVQQVGQHEFYSDFAAAWITSTCRALLWRALAPEKATENVLMCMTDGIYSRVPLSFAEERIQPGLGAWEAEKFDSMEIFKPGIYRYQKKGKMEYKVRGFLIEGDDDRKRLFSIIDDSLRKGVNGNFPSNQFIPRSIALEGWSREPWLRQFKLDDKEIKAELTAKRSANPGSRWLIPDGREHVFFSPKGEFTLNRSIGYEITFAGVDLTDEEDEDAIQTGIALDDARNGIEEFYSA